MNKTIGLFTIVAGALANHPFVGQHSNSLSVKDPNSNMVSARLEPKSGTKYSPHKFATNNNKRHMTLRDKASEFVFGKSFERKLFERDLEAAFGSKNKEKTSGTHRLKASGATVPVNGGSLGYTYIGPINIGGSGTGD